MTALEQAREALLALGSAVIANPRDAGTWTEFDRSLVTEPSARIGVELQRALAIALRADALDPVDVPNVIHRTFASLVVLRRLSAARRQGRLADELAASTDGLDDPLLLLLLSRVRLFGVELELLAVELRTWLLARTADPRVLPFAQALAAQCFANEYVYRVTREERARLEELRVAPPSWWGAVVRACYEPLDAAAVALAPDDAAARDLVRTQILEPRRERELVTASFGAIDDAVSVEVRAQYEARPYPRWTIARPDAQPLPGSLAPPRRMLVAGCGTGKHSLAVARTFPDAQVLAIDLSLASLGYARRKTEEARVENLAFRHGDLLQIGELGETFDAIECVGVLHHLRDPIAGWRALLGVLRPGGWMKIGLYSANARRAVTAMRRELAAAHVGSDDDSIRALRWRLLHDLASPHSRWVAMCADFYDLSECRDLLFHACEHVFTMQQIRRALDDLALELVAIADPAPGRTVDDFAHAEVLESADPDTFVRMVQFWVRRS